MPQFDIAKTKVCFAFTMNDTVLHRDCALPAVPQQGSLVLACAYLPLDKSLSSPMRAFLPVLLDRCPSQRLGRWLLELYPSARSSCVWGQ